ncbi:MAG: hypothetical protein ACXVJT_09595 [Thermoanaerobaculia bacterium]
MFRRLAVVAIAAVLVACHGGSPTEPIGDRATGSLEGTVQIGPNCPVEQEGHPCPTPPEAYAMRKVLVYDEAKTNLLFTLDINSKGEYAAQLLTGKYTVDLKPNGIDRSAEVPAVVTIHANTVTRLDINIDTGLR